MNPEHEPLDTNQESPPSPVLAPKNAPAETSTLGEIYPEPLALALEQMAAAFRASGSEAVQKLFNSPDAFPKIVVVLEKLSKCALEWQELRRTDPQFKRNSNTNGGISEQTLGQLSQTLEQS